MLELGTVLKKKCILDLYNILIILLIIKHFKSLSFK